MPRVVEGKLYPNSNDAKRLSQWLDALPTLWNEMVFIDVANERAGVRPSLPGYSFISEQRKKHAWLRDIPAHVLRDSVLMPLQQAGRLARLKKPHERMTLAILQPDSRKNEDGTWARNDTFLRMEDNDGASILCRLKFPGFPHPIRARFGKQNL